MPARTARTSALGEPADDTQAAAGVSLWRRIADDLEQSIVGGTFQAGSKLPGELELAERFDVNRHTVRRAIAALAERGLVRAERGSGTYIEPPRIAYPIRSRTRFTEIVGSAGRAAGGRLIGSATEPADAEIARRLRLKPGAAVLRLERLRHADRIPLSASTSWLPAERFPGAARVYATSNSITRTFAHFGVRDYSRKSTQVTAEIADAATAANLKIALGRPVLVVDSIDIDAAGVPVISSRTRFAADRLALTIET
jgi:GntR family phosphonate transport system transcriptional regulator